MFKYFSLFLCVLAVSRGAPVNDDQSNDSDETYAAALIKFNDCEHEMLPPQECTEDKIVLNYTLYTRENPNGHKIDPMNNQSLKNSSYNIRDDTKIVIHEWLQNETHSHARDFASAFLKNKAERVNVISVDYGSVSRCDFKTFRYNMQPLIGEKLGQLLKTLMRYGTVPQKFHLIGLGMGAQIAGYTARQIHPRKVGRLTALDPTFVGYLDNTPQLHSNDSDYMDVIHTAQRKFDSVKELGNARFYPNDGSRQPIAGPNKNDKDASVLSHIAAPLYYLQSIVDITYFKARLCNDYLQFLRNRCQEPAVYNYMGDEPNIKLSGNFYLQTEAPLPPFARRPVNVKVFELRRQMEVKVRAIKQIDSAQATLGKQTYEQKRFSEQRTSDEEIKNLLNQVASKTY